MRLIPRCFIALLIVPCIQCQAQVEPTESGSDTALTQALASEADGSDPDCSKNGVCNMKECLDADPDCPQDTPPKSVSWKLTGTVTEVTTGDVTTKPHPLGDKNSSHAAVVALLSRQRSDEPCYVAVGTEDLNDASDDDTSEIDLCGSKGPTSDYISAEFLDRDAGGDYDHAFIQGVDLCMNAAGDKVKGMSAAALVLASDGTTLLAETDANSPNAQRANCDHWVGFAWCPVGQVATQVTAYFDGQEPKDLTGIKLFCRELTY